MNFNWSEFEDSQRECNSQFTGMKQKIEQAYQTQFDENWILNNWLKIAATDKSNEPDQLPGDWQNPFIVVKGNSYMDLLLQANNVAGSVEKHTQRALEKEISATDILEQLDIGPKVEFRTFQDSNVQNKAFFESNYRLYIQESTFEFVPQILNMFLSVSAQNSPWNFCYSKVLNMDEYWSADQNPSKPSLPDLMLEEGLFEVP